MSFWTSMSMLFMVMSAAGVVGMVGGLVSVARHRARSLYARKQAAFPIRRKRLKQRGGRYPVPTQDQLLNRLRSEWGMSSKARP